MKFAILYGNPGKTGRLFHDFMNKLDAAFPEEYKVDFRKLMK